MAGAKARISHLDVCFNVQPGDMLLKLQKSETEEKIAFSGCFSNPE